MIPERTINTDDLRLLIELMREMEPCQRSSMRSVRRLWRRGTGKSWLGITDEELRRVAKAIADHEIAHPSPFGPRPIMVEECPR